MAVVIYPEVKLSSAISEDIKKVKKNLNDLSSLSFDNAIYNSIISGLSNDIKNYQEQTKGIIEELEFIDENYSNLNTKISNEIKTVSEATISLRNAIK